ncbi:2-hydroxyacid dehydrogenase, partial [Pseudomonas stutzeri]|nr:2-hydroxyacid dehydrogenase [Stutzerimonas stutzeri]
MAYLLQVAPLSARLDRELASRYDILPLWQDETAARLDEVAEATKVVVTGSRFGCSAELMARLPALKAIVSFGVGYDPIDVPA